jgi:lipocalin
MKTHLRLFLLALGLPCLLATAQAETPVASVADVDLQRYAGRWF